MRLLQLCLIVLISFSICVHAASRNRSPRTTGCRFTIPSDVPENEPVYLTLRNGEYRLYEPVDRINYIPNEGNIYLFCPGSRNTVQQINSTSSDAQQRRQQRRRRQSLKGSNNGRNMTQLECNQSKFEVNNSVTQLKRLNCSRPVGGDLRTTTRRCGAGGSSGGVLNELGFKIDTRNFISLISSCFNNRTASAIFSKYRINGKAIKFNVKESERRAFKDNGIPASINPNDAYKRNNQVTHFKNFLGDRQNFVNATSYLSRGHLAADADFVFSSGQFATYFYVNVAPQFQIVNGGNWLRVENIARNLASNYETELTIYSGTLGQLRLPSTDGKQKPLSLLEGGKIVVPQYFYKIIIDEAAASAIVFVTYNNPFLHRNAIRPLCEDVCERSGLEMKQFADPRKGYTFCCEYEAFIGQVDISPFSHDIRKLLSCANIELPED